MNKLFKMVVEFFNSLVQAIKKIFCPKETQSRMETWAEREIDLACKRERAAGSAEDEDWDYGCACYESAYKAFQSLMADGHSGMSICFTQQILNRLIDGKPLTPIEDTPDIWSDISDISGLRGEEVNYQCKRMSSLFKYVYAIRPNGERIEINQYFKEGEKDWVAISKEEFEARLAMSRVLEKGSSLV